MKKIPGSLFLWFLIVGSFLTAQPIKKDFQKSLPILFEKNIVPNDTSYMCYLSFRLPLNELIFTSKGDEYLGGVTIDFELKRDDKIFDRLSLTKNVLVKNYDETKSGTTSVQGLISIKSESKDFYLTPILTILHTNQSIKLDSIRFDISKSFSGVGSPLIIEDGEKICGDIRSNNLSNFQNAIPFSNKNYSLIFPLTDTTISNVKIVIEQETKTIIEDQSVARTGTPVIKECDNHITVFIDSVNNGGKYLVASNISGKLAEGNVKVKLLSGDKEIKELNLRVQWFDKPRSLMDLKSAIELLEVIDDKEKVKLHFKGSEEEKTKALNDYWDRLEPNRSTLYNSLMAEFYSRADYALENFAGITNQNGAKTDRGKIYIKFGKPDNIKRDYSQDEIVYELWTYTDIKKEFLFKDESGLGNYILSN